LARKPRGKFSTGLERSLHCPNNNINSPFSGHGCSSIFIHESLRMTHAICFRSNWAPRRLVDAYDAFFSNETHNPLFLGQRLKQSTRNCSFERVSHRTQSSFASYARDRQPFLEERPYPCSCSEQGDETTKTCLEIRIRL
jgi:hypothetical protein